MRRQGLRARSSLPACLSWAFPGWALVITALLLWAGAAQADPLAASRGQTVYVPVYSHIWHGNLDSAGKPARLLLSAMLSIRNTDPDHAITLQRVRYYDDEGKLLRDYLAKPRSLRPLQSTDLFVEHRDAAGGTGASFLVDWSSSDPVAPPVIETVHAYFFGTQSIAFTSAGRPVRHAPE